VDADDPAAPSRGGEQGVGRVDDVEVAAAQVLDGRPVQAVPREVQEAHGNAAVHDFDIRTGRDPGPTLAQGGGEEREPRIGFHPGQGIGQSADVDAHAGRTRKGRTNVESDLHAWRLRFVSRDWPEISSGPRRTRLNGTSVPGTTSTQSDGL
jgi:hypothetical protein